MKTIISILLSLFLTVLLYSQNGWNYQNANLTTNGCGHGAIFPLNSEIVFVIADYGKFHKTIDGGANWTDNDIGISEDFFDIYFFDNNFGFAVGTNGTLIRTDNGGVDWTTISLGIDDDLFSIYINNLNNIWVVGDNGVILFSNDIGVNWIIDDTTTNERLNSIYFKDEYNGFIAGNNGTLLKTTNGGTNWDTVGISSSDDFFSITITENNIFFLSGWVSDYYDSYYFEASEMFKTNDGINWSSYYFDYPYPGLSKVFFQNDDLGFIISSNSTTNGEDEIIIKKTIDSGLSWIDSFNDWNPPNWVGTAYGDIKFVTNEIGYALTGANILKSIDGGTFINVNEFENDNSLYVFPNPTDGIFSIVSDNSNIKKVEIINIIGQRILNEQFDNKSEIEIDFSVFPNGIYIVKIKNNNGNIVNKKVIKT